jgi:hypothetical protein
MTSSSSRQSVSPVQYHKDASGTPDLFLLRQMRVVSMQRTAGVICTPCLMRKSYPSVHPHISSSAPLSGLSWDVCTQRISGEFRRIMSLEEFWNWWLQIPLCFVWVWNFVTLSVEQIEGIWRRSTGEDVLAYERRNKQGFMSRTESLLYMFHRFLVLYICWYYYCCSILLLSPLLMYVSP